MDHIVIIQTPAIFRDRGKLADGTRRLQVDLPEIGPENELEIIRNNGKIGWFLFSPAKMEQTEIKLPDLPALEQNQKPQSQRLRAVIYRYWEQNFQAKERDFETFYRKQTEHLINQYKDKLT